MNGNIWQDPEWLAIPAAYPHGQSDRLVPSILAQIYNNVHACMT